MMTEPETEQKTPSNYKQIKNLSLEAQANHLALSSVHSSPCPSAAAITNENMRTIGDGVVSVTITRQQTETNANLWLSNTPKIN